MSGKHRKIFDNKHFVQIDRPLGPKSGKIVFFEIDDLDTFKREYDEVGIDNIVFPRYLYTMTGAPNESWALLSRIKFKNFKLLRPKLWNGGLTFDYEAEDGKEDVFNPWQDYTFGAK